MSDITPDVVDDDIFDLDAVAAEQRNARRPFRFRFGGEVFEFPPSMDLLVALDLSDGKLREAVQRLLGPEQFERLRATSGTLDDTAFKALLDAYGKHAGADSGKSSA